MKRTYLTAFIVGMGLSALLAGGCETARPGVTNTVGRYDTSIEAPPPRVTQAATDVLEDSYKFKIDSSTYSAIDGKIEAHTGAGKGVTVWVAGNDTRSTVSLRFHDLAGNERLSLEILDKIKERSNSLMARIKEQLKP